MKSKSYLIFVFLCSIVSCSDVGTEFVAERKMNVEQYITGEDYIAKFDSSIAIGDLENAQYYLAKIFQQDSISESFHEATEELKQLREKLRKQ
ncbi:MAG: hypothetical protein AAFO82_06280 [Bacteroidota bacterium]